MASASDVATSELEFLRLRLDYLREKVSIAATDTDAVALSNVLLALHGSEGGDYLDDAIEVLQDARRQFPTSVTVLEHLALLHLRISDDEQLDELLETLGRVDPTSAVIRTIAEATDRDAEEWAAEAAIQRTDQLLADAGSGDAELAASAVAELRRWFRTFPRSSTHAINLALGLFATGETAEAQRTAYDAIELDDGSFADAYNIGIVLANTGAAADGRECLAAALARSSSIEEQDLVRHAIESLDGD